jgi:hypothetical protein
MAMGILNNMACKLSIRFHKYGNVWGIADIAGVMGVSFKIEKRRNRCPVISFRSRVRRAEGFLGIVIQGEPWE